MSAPSRRRIQHSLEFRALQLFAGLLCLLPRRVALACGSGLGRLGWLFGVRRKLVLANLAQALPEASDADRRRIGSLAASSFGRTGAEFIRFGIKERSAVNQVVQVEGDEALREALGKGKGAILLTGHLGSWAVYFAALSLRGIPIALLVGKQHNERIDSFIHQIPGDTVEFISKGRTALKRIIAMLQAGRAVVMVADQHAGKGGVPAPFLGRTALTLSLPGAFAVKHGSPVFFMHGHRLPDGSHRVVVTPLGEDTQLEGEARKYEITRRYNEIMGDAIRAHPEQYFWYHRRWRDDDLEPAEDAAEVP